jgi:tyrosyl-tRNA synthetase
MPIEILDNADWLKPIHLIDFLMETGKHFTIEYMNAKEAVRSRRESGSGMSFSEFSYMLFQARDFSHLYETRNCRLQVGGSDQWGNITTGVKLVRKALGQRVHGLVFPLILDAQGNKLGKTAHVPRDPAEPTQEGTVWLDAGRTSPYSFYQFWIKREDSEVIPYLSYYTFLDRVEIERLAQAVSTDPGGREAQRRLAREMTRMVHGQAALDRAERATRALFSGQVAGLPNDEIRDILPDVESSQIRKETLEGGQPLPTLLAGTTLAKGTTAARRLIAGGGCYLNDVRVSDPERILTSADLLHGEFLILRRGKSRYHIVQATS